MPRHWNIYEKSMPQHAIADVVACVERRLLVVKIRKMDAAVSMVQCRSIRGIRKLDAKAFKTACRGIQSKIFSARMMNAIACELECRDISPVTQKKIKSFILYSLLTQF